MVRKQFQDAFEKHGVRCITPVGIPFDPNIHEAVMQMPSADHPPMTVMQTLQSGYTLYERVIRPAQVIVAAAPPEG
ncbi:MAG: nucleotide exchange factor GrpE [Planctomycetota bacterium]